MVSTVVFIITAVLATRELCGKRLGCVLINVASQLLLCNLISKIGNAVN